MNVMDWLSFWITVKLASITTIILLIIGILLSLWLSSSNRWYKLLVASFLNMPLILPPTVLGFYLLLLFNPHHFIGKMWYAITGSTLSFSFSGLVIASVIYSLPFAVRPIHQSFESVGMQAMKSARLLGASYCDAVMTVLMPLSLRGILTSAVLVFAHVVGEFGVVLMVGGSLPGKTKVISIALFDKVESFQYAAANEMALWLIAFASVVLLLVFIIQKQSTYDAF